MNRTLLSIALLAALAAAPACKKKGETDQPGDGAATGSDGATKPESTPTVPQEPDPAAIAESRAKVILGDNPAAIAALEPILGDLKEREQLRASGLTAAWLAIALSHDVAENAREPAEHALAMAERTADAEVKVAAKLAIGAYNLGTEHFPEAAAAFEEAYKLDGQGPNAALALVYFGETKISMAFDGDDRISNPGELITAAGSFDKAKKLAAGQPGNEALAGRATVGLAAVSRYKNDNAKACDLIKEALTIYKTASVAPYLNDGAVALKEASNCK